MNIGASPMSFTSSSASWKSGDVVPGQFPSGLRVLVVDDDLTCLRILDKMLRTCHYEVTRCSRAEVALKLLRDNKDGYDVVLSDVHMPDMDGFKLLEHIGLEMDLPVIMMSADDSRDVVMKGVTHGACDYLIKPIRMEALKNIWQHVIRKKSQGSREKDSEHSGSEDCEKLQKASEDVDCSSSPNEGNWKSSKKRKDEDDDADERDDSSALKKPRVVWTVDLHQQFVNAVNQLRIDKAVPKKILELMNVPGLTRENVASHLQKYRLYLRRLSHQSGLGNSFMGPSDVQFGSMTPLHGLDLQFASSGQLPPQSLATIQAAGLNPVRSKPTFQSLADQRNIFSFENPKIRFSDVQQQNGSNKQTNLLHGIPTDLDSKQLAALQQSAQPFGNMNMHVPSQSSQNKLLMPQVVQTQPGNQPLNEVNPGHVLNLPSSGSQPILSSGISNGVMGRGGIGNVHLPTYSSSSHHSSLVDYSRNQQQREMLENNVFSFGGDTNSRATSLTSKGTVEAACNSEMRGSRGGFGANYGPSLNDLNRSRTGDWNLQTAGPMYESPQQPNLQVRMDVAPSVVVQPLSSLEPRNAFSNSTTISRPHTTPMADISSRIKAEKLPDIGFHNDFYPNPFDGDDHDIINALQQQDGLLDFDFHTFDNLPV